MSAHDHVSPIQFYHASDSEFQRGQELTPVEAAKHSGLFHGVMYYSDNASEAKNFGNHVYRVTPLDRSGNEVQEHQQGMGPGHFKTPGSLRVEEEVPGVTGSWERFKK